MSVHESISKRFKWLYWIMLFFFFNDTATTEIYTLSLHDALPILVARRRADCRPDHGVEARAVAAAGEDADRSEEHTSELQSPCNLVCRLLLEKKKKMRQIRSLDLLLAPL